MRYKLINTSQCYSEPPEGTENYYINSKDLYLLKCKEDYILEKEGDIQGSYICKNKGNPFTTIITPSTTLLEEPTTQLKAPTTLIEVPTTQLEVPTTILKVPTTLLEIPTTLLKVPTTLLKVPTTEIKVPTTEIKVPTTLLKVPTTQLEVPTTQLEVPTTEIKVSTTEIKVPTTQIKVPTTEIKVPTTQLEEKETIYTNKPSYSTDVNYDEFKICISYNVKKYQKINYMENYPVNCHEIGKIVFKYYRDNNTRKYKTCYKYSKNYDNYKNLIIHDYLLCENVNSQKSDESTLNSDYYNLIPYNNSAQKNILKEFILKNEINQTVFLYDCLRNFLYEKDIINSCLEECPEYVKDYNYVCKEMDMDNSCENKNPYYIEDPIEEYEIKSIKKSYEKDFNYKDNLDLRFNHD